MGIAGQERNSHVEWIDQGLHSAFIVVAGILFIICLTLIMLGLIQLVQGWEMMFGNSENFVEDATGVFVGALGLIVIGIAVLDLTRSILDEELSERKVKNVHERARDFLTRFLPVIIFAISAEIFVKIAQTSSEVKTEIINEAAQGGAQVIQTVGGNTFSNLAMLGIAVGAMLIGLGVYIKMSSREQRDALSRLRA